MATDSTVARSHHQIPGTITPPNFLPTLVPIIGINRWHLQSWKLLISRQSVAAGPLTVPTLRATSTAVTYITRATPQFAEPASGRFNPAGAEA